MKKNHETHGKIKLRLGSKLMISIILLECLLMASIVFVVEFQMRRSIMDEFLKRGLSVSRNLAAMNANFIATYNYVKIEQNVARVKEKSGLLYAVVSFFDGEVAAYSGKESIRKDVCTGQLYNQTLNIDTEFVQYGELEGQRVCDIAIPIFLKGEKWGTVRAGFSLDDIRASILRMRRLLLTLGLIGLVFGCLTSILLARLITRPIGILVKSADLISDGKYDHPIEISTQDEIGYLGQRFAAMQKTLKRNIDLLTGANERLQTEVAVREQREQELRMAKRAADAANIAKSNFLANVSHELRTPLNGVLGLTELLMGTTDLSERQHMLSHNISRSGKSLLGIINEVLDFSAIETSNMRLVKADFNLNDMIEDIVENSAVGAQKKGLELSCLIHHDVPVVVNGDEKRLQQIITNILSNGVKFTEQGEVVMHVQVMGRDDKETTLRFEVSDTGIGIEPEAQTDIFDPFSQADSSHSRQYGGTGLGLSIAKELTELMGGTLDVVSKPGQGSIFSFTASFEHRKGGLKIGHSEKNSLPENFSAFIVDDNKTCRSILSYYLDHWGVTCREIGDPAEAQTILQQETADGAMQIILIDMQIPGTDTLELIRTIKTNAFTANTKFVMLLPIDVNEEEKRDVLSVCHGFLTKPVRRSQLHACFESLSVSDAERKHVPVYDFSSVAANKPTNGYHVLLVEDNAINLTVALEMLETLGYTVDTALNGTEAVEAIERQEYDIIAMDCQMPEMDGYEATRIIRKKERTENPQPPPVPIVALTAHAMEGDRKKCFDAGMNDYLSKPFTLNQLGEKMERWLPASGIRKIDRSTASLASSGTEEDCIDRRALDALRDLQMLNNPDLLTKIINVYFKDAPKQLDILRGAISQGDAVTIQNAVGRLKSSSTNLGAVKLSQLCKELEAAANDAASETGSFVLGKIEAEYQNVRTALESELRKNG